MVNSAPSRRASRQTRPHEFRHRQPDGTFCTWLVVACLTASRAGHLPDEEARELHRIARELSGRERVRRLRSYDGITRLAPAA